jgi:hypothetical protein
MAAYRLSGSKACTPRYSVRSTVDRKRTFLIVLSSCCLLSVAGIAEDVQVNPRDHDAPNQGNLTTQNEPTIAVGVGQTTA